MRTAIRRVAMLAAVAALASAALAEEADTVHVPAFDLPVSEFLGDESRAALRRRAAEFARMRARCPFDAATATAEDVIARRRCAEQHYFPAFIARIRARYAVDIERGTLGGVPVEIITPAQGISSTNRKRVLINLHSGGFIGGGRWSGQVESIPIAALGKFKVVAVDYRLAPEYKFPAASEDVAAVYTALLKEYRPASIGIYGCSAGGVLTAQAVAWFHKERLPTPGAVAMLCGAAFAEAGGDAARLADARSGPAAGPDRIRYFSATDLQNPLASPGLSREVLAQFPDSLLVSATRDGALSTVLVTHARLVAAGVRADLRVWEGLDHAFHLDPDLPEAREVSDIVVRFFGERLRD